MTVDPKWAERASARWAPAEGIGLEHLDLFRDANGIVVESTVVGAYEGAPFGLSYRLLLDPSWRLRKADLKTTAGANLALSTEGDGRWRGNGGNPLPELDGAVDIDIVATPFTNTLPIRRLGLAQGEARDILVAWVALPDLTVQPEPQRYTALEPGKLYRFLALDGGFTADLPVDANGLVLDYPELFRRVALP